MMNSKEVVQACEALKDWLESQEIKSDDAIAVLTLSLAAQIYEVAKQEGLDHVEGGRAAGRGLIKALKLAK